jgi:hypothetical protein
MGRRWIAGACLVAGVAVLVGIGWALLAAAAVVYLVELPPVVTTLPGRVRAGLLRGRAGLLAAWRWLTLGRRSVAIASMPASVILVPIGVGVIFGLGWALVVAGVLLLLVAVLAGWNAARAEPWAG